MVYSPKKDKNVGSWNKYINQTFGGLNNLTLASNSFSKYDKFTKWTYFLALRIHGAKGNNYLSKVIQQAETYDKFITGIFCSILQVNSKDANFVPLYEQRKNMLAQMIEYTDELSSFYKQVLGKESQALHYLTDLTKQEKELAIHLIVQYAKEYNPDKLITILRITYPDLALYLQPFNYGNDYLNKYFKLYKYCKVTNQILPEFMKMVEEQATDRQYNTWLQPRTTLVDALPKDKNTISYFMDALGVEFLSFLQNKCYDSGLSFHANIARCELPSITSMNKEFINEFEAVGCKVNLNRELDDLKHKGKDSYNYENTKLPIHIIRELEILNELISELKTLDKGKTAYVIADHGATRLAVIKEKENKWEMAEKGKHSGRCCPKSDVDEKPDFATEENDFWCLANYDRFKGGRKALVEVHGGATLEEVAIPVIQVNKMDKKIQCKLIDEKPITASYKKKAKMKLFVEDDSDKISIRVNEYNYPATRTHILYHYEVEMADIKNAGTYKFDVYIDNKLIQKDLTFEIKKEGASERKLF
ncbi:MAG: BREX-4 system phosphatase PglZ [Tannerellaceae bacterium]|nr:BREX-4 system phosphatase PglZ [Tannerellaceae bacterium]